MTAPLTDEEIEDYKKARSGRGRGVGKVAKNILPGFLGAGIGAAVSEDATAGGIEGLFPLGFEPSAAGADSTITGDEERKARIRGFPTAMAQQEAEELVRPNLRRKVFQNLVAVEKRLVHTYHRLKENHPLWINSYRKEKLCTHMVKNTSWE